MKKTYIFGHRNPDTDSVCSAISLSYFKNMQGENTEPRILDDISRETAYVLDYFGVKKPKLLDNVKLQIKDVNYHKNYFLKDTVSIKDVYDFLTLKKITGIPIVKEDGSFEGIITLKIILNKMIEGNLRYLNTSYDNILKVLNGKKVLKFTDKIEGNLLVGGYRTMVFVNEVDVSSNNILIITNRPKIINYAIDGGIKTIVVVGTSDLDPECKKKAKANRVNIIRTEYDTFYTTKMISWANYAKIFCDEERIVYFNENDYYNDFVEISKKLKHNNYPVVNNKGKCLGLLRITDVDDVNKKEVILVDHNEQNQSVTGLYQASIIEIIDHHKIGDLTTNSPINFRNMAVGSTCTIVYELYKEKGIKITKEIAGILLSGILSDTLILKSPTTTEIDKNAVKALSKLAKVDYKKLGFNMFKAGTSILNKTPLEVLETDIKTFEFEDFYKYAVSQVITLEVDQILNDMDTYIEQIEALRKSLGCKFLVVAITDILKNGSYFLYTEDALDVLKAGYNLEEIKQGIFIKDQVSRKKQIVPAILKGANILR